jgi:uncharacterized protein
VAAAAAVAESLLLAGPAGSLEALLEIPPSAGDGCAVVCHPHPQHGGTMHNKVVHTLARACRDLGVASLRFNYRGVGASAGQYAEGIGETADALAVAAWAGTRFRGQRLVLAGFSFGGAVAFNAAARLGPAALVTVAPAVDRVAPVAASAPPCPWLIVQGSGDDIVAPDRVCAWAATFQPPPTMALLPGVGHFFHGALTELRAAVIGFEGLRRR